MGTEPKKFRELVRELTWLLGYEAMADLAIRRRPVETPLEPMTAGAELEPKVGLVPVLRAGLGMVDAMLELMPTAEVWHIGLYRDERTPEAGRVLQQAARCGHGAGLPDPRPDAGHRRLVCRDGRHPQGLGRGARSSRCRLIAAPEGVATLAAAHPDVDIHVGASTRISMSAATSCRGWATRATGSSARSRDQPRSPATILGTRRPRSSDACSAISKR